MNALSFPRPRPRATAETANPIVLTSSDLQVIRSLYQNNPRSGFTTVAKPHVVTAPFATEHLNSADALAKELSKRAVQEEARPVLRLVVSFRCAPVELFSCSAPQPLLCTVRSARARIRAVGGGPSPFT